MTAIVFDLDGTLIDSRGSIAAACNHALIWTGRRALDVEVVSSFVGDGARNLLVRALNVPSTARVVDDALAEFLVYYEAHPVEGTAFMPGALETLDALADLPLAVVTNKPRSVTMRVLDALGVTSRFASLIAGGDGPLKPDPAPIHAAISAMGARAHASETWVVGDGVQDIEAGRAAGCKTVAVRGGFASDDKLARANPDFTIDSLVELVSLVRST